MKKTGMLITVIFSFLCMYGQEITVQSVEQVNGASVEARFYPRFTPDGKSLLLTAENYSGLELYSLDTRQSTVLTTDAGAGYMPLISEDFQTVYYRKTELIRNRKFTSLHAVDLTNLQKRQLTEPLRGAAALRTQNLLRSASATDAPVFAYIEDQKIVVEKNGEKMVLAPNGKDKSYIWPEISPDKTKIVYKVAGEGAYIADLSGGNLVALGKVNAPKWLTDSWIVGMDDIDDGHFLISSKIIAVRADGKKRQDLSQTADRIEMYPSASPRGDKIAFNTDKGEVFIMNVLIK